MSPVRCWLQSSVFPFVLVASMAAAHDASGEKKTKTYGQSRSQAKRRSDMFRFSGRQHLVIPKLRYDGSHPITFEATVMMLYRGSIIGDFNGSGLGLDVANGYCSFHVNEVEAATPAMRPSNHAYRSDATNRSILRASLMEKNSVCMSPANCRRMRRSPSSKSQNTHS